MDTSDYLEELAKLYWRGTEFDHTNYQYFEQYSELKRHITNEGIEMGEFGPDPGDGITCIFDNGQLKLTGYISTRGRLYQAGAYDGESNYFATNLSEMHNGKDWFDIASDEWEIVLPENICASIARRAWEDIHASMHRMSPNCLYVGDIVQVSKGGFSDTERFWVRITCVSTGSDYGLIEVYDIEQGAKYTSINQDDIEAYDLIPWNWVHT